MLRRARTMSRSAALRAGDAFSILANTSDSIGLLPRPMLCAVLRINPSVLSSRALSKIVRVIPSNPRNIASVLLPVIIRLMYSAPSSSPTSFDFSNTVLALTQGESGGRLTLPSAPLNLLKYSSNFLMVSVSLRIPDDVFTD